MAGAGRAYPCPVVGRRQCVVTSYSIPYTKLYDEAAGHYLEVVEEMIRRDLPIRWSAFFRPQGLGREELALLKRSGLYALELGTDAACDTRITSYNVCYTKLLRP